MIALAIRAVSGGKPLDSAEKEKNDLPVFSGNLGQLNKDEIRALNKNISSAMKYIKAYDGPSRTWFAYQNSLDQGCSYLSEIISHLPASNQTAGLVIRLLLRLDDKLCRGGIDDSNGTLGCLIEEIVQVLLKFFSVDPKIKAEFSVLKNVETCFGWEEPLTRLI